MGVWDFFYCPSALLLPSRSAQARGWNIDIGPYIFFPLLNGPYQVMPIKHIKQLI